MNRTFFAGLFLISISVFAQKKDSFWKKSDTLDLKKRKTLIIGGSSAYVISMVGINQLWYANFEKSNLHSINDNKEWLQMDKFGHVMTSYYIGKIGMELLDWSGESKKNQLIYGATLGFTFLSTIEIFDGFSKEWGFSFGDILANASGTGLLIGQELLWEEQRIQLKYSFHQTKFAKQNPELLGRNFLENTLKDYNGQTYWISANIWSFNKKSKFPKWLNLALGYGAENMITSNVTNNDNRFRQFYLSLDLDLTKIKTNSKFLKTVFSAVNFIKIPAPTIRYSSEEKFGFYILYF
ncbi:MAG: YfiM family protein [Flavobacteriaceae bacterium]|nr:YfiM family protein [Flavobacteriaceae bacterium]